MPSEEGHVTFASIQCYELASEKLAVQYHIHSDMDFTEIYKQTSGLVEFSPGAQFILTATENRVIVRRTDTLQITRTWQLDSQPSATQAVLSAAQMKHPRGGKDAQMDGWITQIGWSCDSEYILAAFAKKGVVQVLKLRDESWSGRIDSGAEGMVWITKGLKFSFYGKRAGKSPMGS
jgi:hypothetical protein